MLWKLLKCVNQLAAAAEYQDPQDLLLLTFLLVFCSVSALKSAANMPFVDLDSRQRPPSVALRKSSAREEKQLWLAVQFRQQTAKHNESRQYFFQRPARNNKSLKNKSPMSTLKSEHVKRVVYFQKACLVVVYNIFKRRCVTSRSPGKLTLFSSPIFRWCHPRRQSSPHAAFKAEFPYDFSKATVNIYMTIWPQ